MTRDFRELRKAKGFDTLKSLADSTGLAYPLLSMIENGRRTTASPDTLARLAEALQVKVPTLKAVMRRPSKSGVRTWLQRTFAAASPSTKPAELSSQLSANAKKVLSTIMEDPESALLFCTRGDLTVAEINKLLEQIAEDLEPKVM